MFPKAGAYRVLDHPAGYPIFLVLGKDSVLRGFHNVCRHRAYPVVSAKRAGCTPVLSCKYHGWSYDLRGNLVKAPKFDGLEGFNKSENSLFEVSVRVDVDGVVFVNVGALPDPPSAPMDVGRFTKYRVESWEVEAGFNWKFAGNCFYYNLDELYTANNGASEFADAFNLSHIIERYTPKSQLGALFHLLNVQQRIEHIKPTVLTDVLHFKALKSLLMIKVRPVDGGKCVLECAFYSSPAISDSSLMLDDIKEQLGLRIASLETAYAKIKHNVPL